jgi:hypothetical protein
MTNHHEKEKHQIQSPDLEVASHPSHRQILHYKIHPAPVQIIQFVKQVV